MPPPIGYLGKRRLPVWQWGEIEKWYVAWQGGIRTERRKGAVDRGRYDPPRRGKKVGTRGPAGLPDVVNT